MQAGCSWPSAEKIDPELCVLHLWELVWGIQVSLAGRHCGMVEYHSPDNTPWESYASTVTACTLEAGDKKSSITVGKWVR